MARRTSLRPRDVERSPALLILSGNAMGRCFPLSSKNLIIGRGEDADIQLDDTSVSRHHAKIVALPQGLYMIKDLESTSGTFVNQAEVEAHPLGEGDHLQIGDISIKFIVEDAIEAELRDRMYMAAMRDALTNAYNRRALDETLRRSMAFARRHLQPLALLAVDVDHFKKINDTFGHPVGDTVLVDLVGVLMNTIRVEDFLARSGGEEFVIVCGGATATQAKGLAARLLSRIANYDFRTRAGTLKVTVSIGIAEFDPTSNLTDEGLLAEADQQLYAAKRAGRNCIRGA